MDNNSYLAGIIDGEGTININYNKSRDTYTLRIYVVSTDVRLIEWLKDNYDGWVYKRNRTKSTKSHWKDRWEWHLQITTHNKSLLTKLEKILLIKREQVSVAIRFMDTINLKKRKLTDEVRSIRKECKNELRILNNRGVATTK